MEIYRLVKPNVVLNTKIMFSNHKINSENVKISFLILFFSLVFLFKQYFTRRLFRLKF